MILLLSLFFLLLQTYLIRFHIGPIPTTVLEVFFLIIVVIWLTKEKNKFTSRLPYFPIALFIFAATISVFTSLDTIAALGVWKAFYVEPILLFLILVTTIKTEKQIHSVLIALILSGLITSLFAIYQHFTGFFVPWKFWGNGGSYRVTAWYGFPNAVGLFLAPLLPLAFYLAQQSWNDRKKKREMNKELRIMDWTIFAIPLLMIPASLFTILFAKSTGGLVGVAAGILTLLLLHKKTRLPTIVIGAIVLLGVFLLPRENFIRQELLLQDRSGQIRIAIWSETFAFLRDHPVLGAGLASYQERIVPYHGRVNGENIEIFHHPHNIFLTMWVNLGILGLTGFVLILIWFYRAGIRHITNDNPAYRTDRRYTLNAYLIASMTALLVTGLVDSPYIKNDLAMFFWLLPALLVIEGHVKKTSAVSR